MAAPRALPTVINDFNTTILAMIGRLEKKSRSDIELANLYRLRERIKLLKGTMGQSGLLSIAAPLFTDMYGNHIINRNEKFFMEVDARKEYLRHHAEIKADDEFAFALFDSIRTRYQTSDQSGKDEIYADLNNLLACCLEYKVYEAKTVIVQNKNAQN